MAIRNHLPAVAALIRGQGLNVPDSDIYEGPKDAKMPDTCIFMQPAGGPEPEDHFGTNESVQEPVIQVRVRVTPDAYLDGVSDAHDIWQILHDERPSSDYSSSTMRQSSPLYLGQDDDGRHEWSINVQLFICE